MSLKIKKLMPLITRAFPDNFTTSQVKGWEFCALRQVGFLFVLFGFFLIQTPKKCSPEFFLAWLLLKRAHIARERDSCLCLPCFVFVFFLAPRLKPGTVLCLSVVAPLA